MDSTLADIEELMPSSQWTFSIEAACSALRRKALQPSKIFRFQIDSVRAPLVVKGACWWAPRYERGQYFAGYWEGDRGRIHHDHRWDRDEDRDFRERGRGRGRGHNRE